MTIAELFVAQLTDPFRIVLTIGLVLTMLRTRAATGTWLPLAAGVAFIAILIPTTLKQGEGGLAEAIGVGLVSTGLITAAALGIATLVLRGRGR